MIDLDKRGNILRSIDEFDPTGFSWKATYDQNGNRLSYENSDGLKWIAAYDSKNRQTGYADNTGYEWNAWYRDDTFEPTTKVETWDGTYFKWAELLGKVSSQ